MFCFKCGYQIAENSRFCSNCGTTQNTSATIITTNPQSESKELDREAIIIHLRNVLSLEYIKRNLEKRIQSLNNDIATIRNNNYIKRYSFLDDYNHIWLCYDGETYYIAYTDYANGCVVVDQGFSKGWYWLPIEQNIRLLKSRSVYYLVTSGLFGFIENQSRISAAKSTFLESYESFKSEAPGTYQFNLNLINSKSVEWTESSRELNEAIALLNKAYEINIIPGSFRNNIHAIYFLYDFMTTSTQSFTTALLHCDLDKIKEKLNVIIEQQQNIIINQTLQMCQNEKIMKQNEQQLHHLVSIERNSDKAAQYAQISANNTEVCSWIALANYIKD